MRKRSEVGAVMGSTTAPLPGQTPMFVQCKCGLKMSAAAAAQGCLRCGEPVSMDPVTEQKIDQREPKPEQPAMAKVEPDPWSLKAESVTPKVESNDHLAARKQQEQQLAKPIKGERPFVDMERALRDYEFDVSLAIIANWTPGHRDMVWGFIDSHFQDAAPPFLKPYWRGHEKSQPKPTPANIQSISTMVGDEITYTWGEEAFFPITGNYSKVLVGPFMGKGKVLPGETYEIAYNRIGAQVIAVAEAERDRKVKNFMAKYARVVNEARS